MAAVIKEIFKTYTHLNDDLSDPRGKDLLFMSSPWAIIGVVGLYLYFVKNLGVRIMRNREPFKLDRLIMVYNGFQIVVCVWFTYQAVKLVWTGSYRFYCEPVDYSDTPEALWIVRVVWGYFMLKVLDLLDTVFFVLRKKNNQITFLHVYHHTGMVFGTWIGVKFLPGGHAVFLGLINSIVHTVMYTYYLLTNINPDYKKSIWWKKYITQLQMAQFLILLVQSLPVLFKEDCNYPRSIGGLLVTQNFFMLILFYDFYRRAYHPKKIAQS